jgi:hypothetical protein
MGLPVLRPSRHWLPGGRRARRWAPAVGAAIGLVVLLVWDAGGYVSAAGGLDGSSPATPPALTPVWSGSFTGFPDTAWRDAWGVTSGMFDNMVAVADPSTSGGTSLRVGFGATGGTPACTGCPDTNGGQFYATLGTPPAPRTGVTASPPRTPTGEGDRHRDRTRGGSRRRGHAAPSSSSLPPTTAPGSDSGSGSPDLSAAAVVDLWYPVKAPAGFDFVRGGVLPGLFGGAPPPSGTDGSGVRWSTRFAWSAGGAGGVLAAGSAGSGIGTSQLIGAGTWTFTGDDRWHQVEQRVDRSAGTITLLYDGRQAYAGPLAGLASSPVGGILFSALFGGTGSGPGPSAATSLSFGPFVVSTDQGPAQPEPSERNSDSPGGTQPSAAPEPSATPGDGGSGDGGSGDGGSGGSGQTRQFYVTLYGAHDNTPADSRAIAYPRIHQEAGGTGTYEDPLTFATDLDELAPGTIIYYPYVKKYFVMEDDCAECDEDWTGNGPDGGPGFAHIDLWAGDSNDPAIEDCEAALTQEGQVEVIVNPPNNLPIVTTPLYDGATGGCYQPR